MILDRFLLTDRVAIITAAGRGIGAGIAQAYAEAGADVVIGSRTESQLQEVASAVAKVGRRAVVVPGDVSERAGMQLLVDRAMEEFGRIDIVVNNAGGSMPGPFLGTSEEAFNEAMRWNVTTAFNLTQLATPHLLKSDGASVINIASAVGRLAERGFIAYGTAKAAMIHLTRNLATDLSPRIRVNAIAPGYMSTPMAQPFFEDPAYGGVWMPAIPMKRPGQPEELGPAAVFLASEASSYVTGATIVIDGGYTIW